MQEKRGKGAATQLAEALKGMSSGRQAHVNLSGVKPDLVLVAGSNDQKFVGLAESMTQVANVVQSATNGGIAHGTVASPCKDASADGIYDSSHAVCHVIQNCGHAVHLERPEAVVHLLQSLMADNDDWITS